MSTTILSKNSISYQEELQLPWGFEDSALPADDISSTIFNFVRDSQILHLLGINPKPSRRYDPASILTIILLCFALHGSCSSRKMVDFCRHDSRGRLLMKGQVPSHVTFVNFMNDFIRDDIEEIFALLNLYIDENVCLDLSALFIDGTKFEADASKFSFVWRKTAEKNLSKACSKAYQLLAEINKFLEPMGSSVPFSPCMIPDESSLEEARKTLSDLMEEMNISFKYGKGQRKSPYQRYHEQLSELILKIHKWKDSLDHMGTRNSLSKSDYDATFMHMKYDYYCNTGVFKPGYNCQIGVMDQFIRVLYVSADPNDQKPFIPTVEAFKALNGFTPKKICADAGYSSFTNYTYLNQEGIENFVKPQNYEKLRSRSRKDAYKAYRFTEDDEGVLRCPMGHAMKLMYQSKPDKDGKTKSFFIGTECASCPDKEKCTPKKENRMVQKVTGLDAFNRTVIRNIESDEGKELLRQRSIQAEGTFGQIKQDFGYVRLTRTGYESVKMELFLVAIGHNFRKLHQRLKKQRAENNPSVNIAA